MINIKILFKWSFITLILTSLGVSFNTNARQFRLLTPIASPEQTNNVIPEGAIPVENIEPVSRQQIEPLIKDMLSQWNTADMASTLSEQFYDKSRLMDVMDTGVPRDAKLRVQSVQGVQTLSQYINPSQDDERDELVSIVSATVRTQLEFNNTSGSFVSRTGTNEFILKVSTAAPPR